MIEQFKQTLNTSSMDLERRMVDHKFKSDRSHNVMTSQFVDSQSKIALMEREISMYKERLVQLNLLKTTNNGGHTAASNSNDPNMDAFFLNSHRQMSSGNVAESSAQSNGSVDNTNTAVKVVKVSRKNLRQLTEDEILKRSVNK